MEERPAYTVALIRKFLDGPPVAHTVAINAGHTNEALALQPCRSVGLGITSNVTFFLWPVLFDLGLTY